MCEHSTLITLMVRIETEPSFNRIPVKWDGELTAEALDRYVRRCEDLGDVTVGWAEIFDPTTGVVVQRYDR